MTGTVAVMTNGGTAESGAIFTVTSGSDGGGTVPQAPSNLVATPASLEISLQWSDNSNNELGFKVERRIVPTTIWTELTSLPPNTRSYTDGGLAPNFSYVYRVRAFNDAGNSDYSNEAGGRPDSF